MPKPALSIMQSSTELQRECRLVEAEECLRSAFWTDVRPASATVATRARAGRRSLAGPSRQWLYRARGRGARSEKQERSFELCLSLPRLFDPRYT